MGAPDAGKYVNSLKQQAKAGQGALPVGAQGGYAGNAPDPRQYITGQNLNGQWNGWGTPFIKNFVRDYQSAIDAGTAGSYFEQKKDGIALYSDPLHDDPAAQSYRMGDIFKGGKKVTNLYDAYGQQMGDQILGQLVLGAEAAQYGNDPARLHAAVMAKDSEVRGQNADARSRGTFDTEVQAKKDALGDSAGVVSTGIGAVGGALTYGGLGATIGTMILPGAGTLIGGAIGGVGGAIVGGFGGYANQDEMVDRIAQTEVKLDHVNPAAALGEFAQGAGGVADLALNPLTQVTHGAMEIKELGGWGSIGDDQSAYYGVDKVTGEKLRERQFLKGGVWQGLSLVAGFGDMAARMSSILGSGLYQGTIAAQLGGGVESKLLTGFQTFDEVSGTYRSFIQDEAGNLAPGRFAAAIADTGIDAVQMLTARSMGGVAGQLERAELPATKEFLGGLIARTSPGFQAKVAAASAKAAPVTAKLERDAATSATGKLAGWQSQEAKQLAGQSDAAVRREVVSGAKFRLDAEEHVLGKAAFHYSRVAPSEAVKYGRAYLSTLAKVGGRRSEVTGQKLYDTMKRQESVQDMWGSMVANGFGEGLEEAVQAVLQPLETGRTATLDDVWDAWWQGGVMGAGMTFGSLKPRQSAQKRQVAKVKATLGPGGLGFSDEEIAALPPEQVQKLMAAAPEAQKAMTQIANEMRDSAVLQAYTGNAESARILDFVQLMYESKQKKMNQPGDASYKIIQENMDLEDHMNGMSINTLVDRMEKKVQEMQVQNASDHISDVTRRSNEEQIGVLLQDNYLGANRPALLPRMQELQRQYYEMDSAGNYLMDEPARLAAVRSMNQELQRLWDVSPGLAGAEPDTRAARAVSLLSLRHPVDNPNSWQIALPQIGHAASTFQADGVIQMTLGPTEGMGADFDGDRISLLVHLLSDPEQFRKQRSGLARVGLASTKLGEEVAPGQLGPDVESENSVIVATTRFEKLVIPKVYANLTADPNSVLSGNMVGVLDGLKTMLLQQLEPTFGFEAARTEAIVDRYIEGLKTGKIADSKVHPQTGPLTKQEFYRELVKQFPNALSRAFDMTWKDPFFRMNTTIRMAVRELNDLETTLRHTVEAGKLVASMAAPAPHTMQIDFESQYEMVGATNGQILDALLIGVDEFRKHQSLNYSDENSNVVSFEKKEERANTYRYLTRLTRLLSSGETDTPLELMEARDVISARALRQLHRLQRSLDKELGSGTPALGMIANMLIPNVMPNGDMGAPPTITLARFLMLESARIEESKPGYLDNEQVQTRVAQVKKMSNAAVFVEVFEPLTFVEVLGEQGRPFGLNKTVGQWTTQLNQMHERERADVLSALRTDRNYLRKDKHQGKHNMPWTVDDYLGTDGNPPITAYQSTLDALAQYSTELINWRRQDDGRYVAEGTVARQSDNASKGWRAGHAELWTLARMENIDTSSGEEWSRLMNLHEEAAQLFLATIPDELVPLLLVRQADGKVRPAAQVYEALTEQDPVKAEHRLWLSTLLRSWQAVSQSVGKDQDEGSDSLLGSGRQYHQLKSRLHQLLYRLANNPKSDLSIHQVLAKLRSHNSVEESVEYLNNVVRQHEPAFTAWSNDVAALDPLATGGGWSKQLAGTDNRAAMSELGQGMKNYVTSLPKQVRNDADRTLSKLLMSAVQMREDPNAPTDGWTSGTPLLNNLDKVVEHAATSEEMLGAGALLDMMENGLLGHQGNYSDKAKPGTGNEGTGQLDAMEAVAWTAVENQVLGSGIPLSWDQVKAHPRILAEREFDFMDEHGHMIHWVPLTGEQVAKLWATGEGTAEADRTRFQPLLMQVYFPSVQELTPGRKLQRQSLIGTSLNTLLDPAAFKATVFSETDESRLAYSSYIDAGVKKYGGSKDFAILLNAYNVARTSKLGRQLDSVEKRTAHHLRTTELVTKLLKQVSLLSEIPDANTGLSELDIIRETYMKMIDEEEQNVGWFTSPEAHAAAAIIEQEQLKLIGDQVSDGRMTPAEAKVARDQLTEMMKKGTVERAATLYSLRVDDTTERRKNLMSWARNNPHAVQSARYLREQMSPLLQQDWPKDATTGLPALTDEHWLTLSDGIVTLVEEERLGMVHGTRDLPNPKALGEVDDALIDPYRRYLLTEILRPNSPMVRSARDANQRAGIDPATVGDRTEVVRLLSTMMGDEELGEWTDREINATIQPKQRWRSAPSNEAISMSGLAVQLLGTLTASTEVSYHDPGAGLLSTAHLNMTQLFGSKTLDIAGRVTGPSSGNRGTTELGMLQGRGIASIRITRDGVTDTLDPVANRSPDQNFALFPTDARARKAGYGFLDLDEFQNYMQARVRSDANPDYNLWEVEIDFFHPADKPLEISLGGTRTANAANNAWFDGSVPTGGLDLPSLLSSAFFGAGGWDPGGSARALKAAKKGAVALLNPNLLSWDEIQEARKGFRTDMMGVLRKLTTAAMSKDLGDGSKISSQLTNVVMKYYNLHTFVRGFDANGAPVMLTADQLIQMQSQGVDPGLTDMSLWLPSERILRTMHNPGDPQGEQYVPDRFDATPRVTHWQGVLTPAMRDVIPGAFEHEGNEWVSPGAMNTRIIEQPVLRQNRLSIRKTAEEKTQQQSRHAVKEQRRREIREAIAQTSGSFKDDLRKGYDNFSKEARSALKGNPLHVTLAQGTKAIEVNTQTSSDLHYSASVVDSMTNVMTADQYQTGYVMYGVLPHNVQGATGILTSKDLREETAAISARSIMPDSPILMKLSTYAEFGETRAVDILYEDLRHAMNIDMVITLDPRKDILGLTELARTYLTHNDYERVAGSAHVYQRVDREPMSIAQRSYTQRATTAETIPTHNLVVIAHTPDLDGMEENGAWWLDQSTGQYWLEKETSVPLNTMPGFHSLTSIREREILRNWMNTPGLLDQLKLEAVEEATKKAKFPDVAGTPATTLTQTDQQRIERSVEHAFANLANLNAAGNYDYDADFHVGDYVPRINDDGKIIMYRHGHEAPTAGQVLDFIKSDDLILHYGPTPFDLASTYSGKVKAFEALGEDGFRVSQYIPASVFGGKLQIERDGGKVLPNAPREGFLLPATGGIKGWDIQAIAGTETGDKGVYEGMMDNFRNAFGNAGWDFRGDLSKYFFGKDDPALYAEAAYWMKTLVKELPRLTRAEYQQMIALQSIPTYLQNALLKLTPVEALSSPLVGWAQDTISNWGKDTVDPSSRIATNMLLFLMTEGTRIEDVILGGGLNHPDSRQVGSHVKLMPEDFTDTLEAAEFGTAYRADLINRIQTGLYPVTVAGQGYRVQEDLSVVAVADDPRNSFTFNLQLAPMAPSGSDPELDLRSRERKLRDAVTTQPAIAASAMWGLDTFAEKGAGKLNNLLKDQEKKLQEVSDVASLNTMLRRAPEDDAKPESGGAGPSQTLLTAAQLDFLQSSREYYKGTRVKLDQSDWVVPNTDDPDTQQLDRFRDKARSILNDANLLDTGEELVHYWVRQHTWSPSDKRGTNTGKVSFEDAMRAAEEIHANIKNGRIPNYGGAAPVLSYRDAELLLSASKDGRGLQLRSNPNDPNSVVTTIGEWANISTAFGDRFNAPFVAAAAPLVDGLRHTWMDAMDFPGGMAVSYNEVINEALADPNTSQILWSVNERRNTEMDSPLFIPGKTQPNTADEATLDSIFSGTGTQTLNPDAVARDVQRKAYRWSKGAEGDSGITAAHATTERDYAEYGASTRIEGSRRAAVWRNIHYWRAGKATFDPAVWGGAYINFGQQVTLNALTSLIQGNATSRLVLPWNNLDPKERELYRKAGDSLGDNQAFQDMVNDEVKLEDPTQKTSKLERGLRGFARFGGIAQDPFVGTRPSTIGRTYAAAVLTELQNEGQFSSLTNGEMAMRLHDDPYFVAKISYDAHRKGLTAIKNLKLMKDSPLGKIYQGTIGAGTRSNKALISIPANMLHTLTMFAPVYANMAELAFGLQLPNAIIATMLSGRKNGPGSIFGRMSAAIEGRPFKESDEIIDMTDVIESIDLTQALVKSGVTWTALMGLGMIAGNIGLTGEDEEDRRRRLAARTQGVSYIYDPNALENDFRNADAIYLDWLPFNLGAAWKTPDVEGAYEGDPVMSGRSIVHMGWLLKSVLSPIIGTARFFNTGNPWELWHGFTGAVGSFPLLNWDTIGDTFDAFAELNSAAADAAADGSPAKLEQSNRLLMTFVMTAESVLLESSFINSIYQSMDKYDRDPWKLVERNATGQITTNRLGQPQKTGAMEDFIDLKTGEPKSGYLMRDEQDALLHGYTENRLGLALLAAIPTGMWSSDAIRYNMAIKERKIDKTEINLDEADAHIRTFLKHPELVAKSDLTGLYIPFEMRQALVAKYKNESFAESKKRGLNEYKTMQRWNKLWYGNDMDPNSVGLKDIIWSKDISYSKSDSYLQLNTTYVQGPDGKFWATGFRRDLLSTMSPAQGYYMGERGLPEVDSRLNSIDPIRGINTGMRGLEKVHESWAIPEEAQNAMAQSTYAGRSFKPFKFRRFPRRGGGGGGGGGGGYGTKLYAPENSQVPFGNTIEQVNVPNTIIRRASIRRERIDSQKGRLNPWQ